MPEKRSRRGVSAKKGVQAGEQGPFEYKSLSRRHKAILRRVARGERLSAVAKHFGCSPSTVHRLANSTLGGEYLDEVLHRAERDTVTSLAFRFAFPDADEFGEKLDKMVDDFHRIRKRMKRRRAALNNTQGGSRSNG